MAEIEASIQRYLTELETANRQEPEIAQAKAGRGNDIIAALKARVEELQAIETQLAQSPDGQLSLTDPDAGSMKTRGTGIVGYNVPTAVDTKHHLIVAHEVTNAGVDRDLVLDAMERRLDRAPDSMRIRRQTVEHPFGILKAWMGATHFLTRTLD